jgi:hypothetical protein
VTAVFPARTANGRVHQNVLHAAVFLCCMAVEKKCFLLLFILSFYINLLNETNTYVLIVFPLCADIVKSISIVQDS